VEFDVHVTADGEFVVAHDAEVSLGGRTRPLAAVGVGELAAHDVALPRVADVCAQIPAPVVAHVDVKFCGEDTGSDGTEERLADLVDSLLGAGRYIFTSTDVRTTRRLAQWCADRGRANCVGLSVWKPLSRGGRRGWLPPRQWLPTARFRASGAGFIVVHHWLARAGVLAWADRNGIRALVWTCDSDRSLRTFLADARVWAVTSNDPVRALSLR
jgi:glycerophosphoryl diester phosphodiesterase